MASEHSSFPDLQQQKSVNRRFKLAGQRASEAKCELYSSPGVASCFYPFALFLITRRDGSAEPSWALRGHPGFLHHAELVEFYSNLWSSAGIDCSVYDCGWLHAAELNNLTMLLFACDSAAHASSESRTCTVQWLAREFQFSGAVIRCNNRFHNEQAATMQHDVKGFGKDWRDDQGPDVKKDGSDEKNDGSELSCVSLPRISGLSRDSTLSVELDLGPEMDTHRPSVAFHRPSWADWTLDKHRDGEDKRGHSAYKPRRSVADLTLQKYQPSEDRHRPSVAFQRRSVADWTLEQHRDGEDRLRPSVVLNRPSVADWTLEQHQPSEEQHRDGEDKHQDGEVKHQDGENLHRDGEDKNRHGKNKHRDGKDKHRDGEDKHRDGEDKHRDGEDKHRGAEDKHRGGEDKHRGAEDKHRGGEDKHRGAEDKHRGGEDKHRGGEDKHRGGEDKHKPSGSD